MISSYTISIRITSFKMSELTHLKDLVDLFQNLCQSRLGNLIVLVALVLVLCRKTMIAIVRGECCKVQPSSCCVRKKMFFYKFGKGSFLPESRWISGSSANLSTFETGRFQTLPCNSIPQQETICANQCRCKESNYVWSGAGGNRQNHRRDLSDNRDIGGGGK